MNCNIISNLKLSEGFYEMEIECKLDASPGQFVEISVPGFFLRRPISICEIKENSIVIIYKVLGDGTKKMTELKDTIDILGPLGKGFPIEDFEDVFLIGGGVGIPPLYEVAKRYRGKNKKVNAVLGLNNSDTSFFIDKFKELGCDVYVSTMDASIGTRGDVLDAISKNGLNPENCFTCGPISMLKAVSKFNGYMSLEARMACGIGVCMGCVVSDRFGNKKRVCVDGPVFKIGEIVL